MSKVGHVGDFVGDGDEDGLANQDKLRRKGVSPNAIRIVDPIDRIVSSIIKYEYLPQRLVNAGLEMSPCRMSWPRKAANRLKLA